MQDKIILGLLLDGDKSSYDLKKNMEASTGYFYNTSQGSIQPALKKLVQNGHVTFYEENKGERVKKVYTITKEGEKEFLKWVSQGISIDKPREPALVKMFFFNHVHHDQKVKMIEEYLHEIGKTVFLLKMMKQNSIEQIEKSKKSLDQNKIKSRMSTLEFGIDYYSFLYSWYEKYVTNLKDEF